MCLAAQVKDFFSRPPPALVSGKTERAGPVTRWLSVFIFTAQACLLKHRVPAQGRWELFQNPPVPTAAYPVSCLGLPATLSWLVAAWLQNGYVAQLGFNPPCTLPCANTPTLGAELKHKWNRWR